jgi:putative intracellular protease/amidase
MIANEMNETMKSRQKNCIVFLFDGFSDWEISYATVGITKSRGFKLKTMSFNLEPVTSMGGLTVVPDTDFQPETDLADIDASNTAILILPGGTAWEHRRNEAISPLVAHCLLQGIPVAAICGATVFLADAGLLNRTAHTSNDVAYLEWISKTYTGRAHYLSEQVVSAGNLITAGATAPVEFAREIFARLDIDQERDVADWFGYFRKQLIAV